MLAGAVYLATAHSLMAQPGFRVTDADGNVTFTDTPPVSGASAIEGKSVHAPNSAKPTQTTRAPVEVEEPTRQDTRIVARADNPTIPMEAGNFVVQAAWTPRLASGETLQLLLDGEPVGAPQRIANWQLTNVYRGQHRLQVVRLDESGTQLDTSAASTVYVMRPKVNR
tara:strand:- start:2107 stop:2610 length:504 start_codon:yes stop_codon:yes gene_type:complete